MLPSDPVQVRLKSSVSDFCAEETGAVTVDWVVLTSALVGLGLAVVGVVATGVQGLSLDTEGALSSVTIETAFAEEAIAAITTLFSGDFSDGMNGFIGGTLVDDAGFGEVIQIGPHETTQLTLDVPAGSTEATISFDLIGADDFDGDTATIWINGQAVSMYTDDNGNITLTDMGVSGVSVSVDQQYTETDNGGGGLGDSRATYSITVTDPGTSISFGVSSDATAGASNEFYAIDDVSVTAQ